MMSIKRDDPVSDDGWGFETRAVRAGFERTHYGEHSEPIFLTSSFVHQSAQHAAEKFANEAPGFIYSRFGNPTIQTFQDRLAALEGADACLATASGMSAIMSVLMSLTRAGDHVVSSQGVFGTTIQLFGLFGKYGIETSYVPLSDPEQWRAALRPNTRFFYLETPSNPLTEVADIRAIAEIAHSHGVQLVVDNCFCTPALQRPLELGADIVVHSATKYLDGQGRILAGAVLGSTQYVTERLQPVVRYTGPTLSAFNAWLLIKGMETLSLRMDKQSANALELAHWLEQQPGVARVFYPGLPSHPQHALAMSQQSSGGAVLSFEMAGENDAECKRRSWQLVDGCKMISITANLGDTKSTITHPASTTHGRLPVADRKQAGVSEGLIRIAVGLESPRDLCRDLGHAVNAS
jgi:O-succinylhomoserine sulfhydrylase